MTEGLAADIQEARETLERVADALERYDTERIDPEAVHRTVEALRDNAETLTFAQAAVASIEHIEDLQRQIESARERKE